MEEPLSDGITTGLLQKKKNSYINNLMNKLQSANRVTQQILSLRGEMWQSNKGLLHSLPVGWWPTKAGSEKGGRDGYSCSYRLNYHQESDKCISEMAIWIITSTRGEIKRPLSETGRQAQGHSLNPKWGVCVCKVEIFLPCSFTNKQLRFLHLWQLRKVLRIKIWPYLNTRQILSTF